MTTLTDFRTLVSGKVQDDSNRITTSEMDQFIQEAVKQFSKDRPLVKVVDIAGDGGYDYSLPSDFHEGLSVIRSLEYPAGEREPSLLESDGWLIYREATGPVLRLLRSSPQSGETVRLTYTSLHTVDLTSSTIPQGDEDALASLAAAGYARALASYYAQTSDPTLGADSVNYRSKAQEYASLAEEMERAYKGHVGIRRGETTSASSRVKDWDTELSVGKDYLFHGKRWR